MLNQKDLFAKALLVEKPWFVHEIKLLYRIFDQVDGVDHDRPIRIDWFRCFIFRHIRWSSFFGTK